MNNSRITPKDFFLWAGAMLSLYISVFSFVSLAFEYIDRAFPDALNSYVDPYSGSIRFAIASLLVLFPAFLIMMRFIRADITRMPEKQDIWIRRWALFLTVFIAGAAVATDLIVLVNSFLGGDITTRFVLKVLVVLLIACAGFVHFLSDIRGYWGKNPKRANLIGYASAAVVVLTIVSGFFIVGSPTMVRNYRFDDQKVNDLTNIQYQVLNYWQVKEKLPRELAELEDSLSGYQVPKDPQTGEAYGYETISALSFKLCATFNATIQNADLSRPLAKPSIPLGAPGSVTDIAGATWEHGPGTYCFVRTIDPTRYPPYNKGTN